MPQLDRPLPPYAQIANHYRDAIRSGDLQPGAKLPALPELAETWGVAPNTAAKAMSLLQVEGAVITSPRGTFVADGDVIASTPGEFARGQARRQRAASDGVMVTAAEAVNPPAYVAELLDIEPGDLVIRREEIWYRHARPIRLLVDWAPAGSVMNSAELLAHEPIDGGIERMVQSASGRTISHRRTYVRGRASDGREADALRLPVGSPILAGTHVWSDDEGVILYGEWCLPADQVISFDYDDTASDDD